MITQLEAYKKIGDDNIYAFSELRNSYLFWSSKLFGTEEFYAVNKNTESISKCDTTDIIFYKPGAEDFEVPDDWDENYFIDYEALINDKNRIKPISEIFKEDNLKEAI